MGYNQVCNDPDGLQELIDIIEAAQKNSRDAYANLSFFLEEARRNGTLDEENYQQFLAPGAFSEIVRMNFADIYETETPKMLERLQVIKKKLEDYWL